MSAPLMMPTPTAGSAAIAPRKPAPRKITCHFPPLRHVNAIENVEALQGGTEPVLMRADDGHLYVVKFSTNPFGPRMLVNEYLAARLAHGLGLSTPATAIVRVPEGLAAPTGAHFGSRVCKSRGNVYIHEWLPAAVWGLVANPADLIGAYCFDAWTGNADCRQVIFVRTSGVTPFRLFLIDHGHCFGGKSWCLPGFAVQCPVRLRFAYANVTHWSDLDPWLSTIEGLDSAQVRLAAEGIPEEWLAGNNRRAFDRLLDELDARRFATRALIASLLDSGSHPFSCWRFRSSLFVVPPPDRALKKTA